MDPMEPFKATFFQECEEQMAELEAGLLALESGEGDGETINAVFRAVHSVKGGAGAFGFDSLVKFAHVFETALDAMRSGALEVEPEAVKIMLRASDVLADHVLEAKGQGQVDCARAQAMAEELAGLTSGGGEPLEEPGDGSVEGEDSFGFTPLMVDLDEAPAARAPQADVEEPGGWRLSFAPTEAMYAKGNDALLLLRELERLGAHDISLESSALPEFDFLNPEASYCKWSARLPGDVPEADIRDVFDFVGDDCPLALIHENELIKGAAPPSLVADLGLAPALASALDDPFATTPAPPPAAPVDVAALLSAARAEAPQPAPKARPAVKDAPAGEELHAGKEAGKAAAVAATIRVDLDRVDRLIDLVGELVINQAMLAQRVSEANLARSSTVAIGLDELEQLTREIQDSVMAIRAQPVKSVFQRMPRLVREIASATRKEVRLVTEGENTEVDKTVIERLSDPITHMLRNAIDHGLESPEERVAAGKPAEGVVRLAALHRSGRIVIEVSDDGRGINRPRVRDIAVSKGLIAADASLTDEEVDNLIFLPGFSTAQTISDISGRGVGMDVVKRSIQALGGRISISSQPGKGSTFTMSLPLTLAVLDGMVVTAAEHTLVAPLTAIVETLRPKPNDVRRLGPRGAVLAVRGAHVPLIDVGVALGWRPNPVDPAAGVTLLVESEVGGRAALVVDAIQGQRQVVIKSLEANYQRVEAIAAATILGDGRVALILDVDAVIDSRFLEKLESQPLAQAS
ncbi:MAG: chemotaxis protein CheA [Hydrogenophilaceae bacterium]|jgi:two-component system chemotaxis sensor kinase CheA|nr:chemotaxis protein CheA [Hydrogenophilaceae bacterium]